ncbi:MAG: Zn-ribbon domain-containing OB-fold protein [Dehalococcoidia bacterium]
MPVAGVPILEDRYPSTMDLYPLEAKEFNRIHQFYKNLKEKRFTTTKCKRCAHVPFPPRVICPKCNSEDLEWVDLPTRGKVLYVTEEVAGVPLGFEAPLIHALVDLGEGRTLLSRIVNCEEGQLKDGDEVQLAVFDIPPMTIEVKGAIKQEPRVFFAFEPVKK